MNEDGRFGLPVCPGLEEVEEFLTEEAKLILKELRLAGHCTRGNISRAYLAPGPEKRKWMLWLDHARVGVGWCVVTYMNGTYSWRTELYERPEEALEEFVQRWRSELIGTSTPAST